MAKTRAYGADAQLLAAFEGDYGVTPDGSGGGVYTQLSFRETSLGAERPLGYDPLLGQGRDAQDPFYEAVTDEGEFGVPLDLRAIGFWLTGLFGAPSSADNGDGTHSHSFTSGGDLPSMAFEIGHTGLATPRYYRHGGCVLESIGFDMARTGPANATIAVVAQGESNQAAPADPSPLSYALRRFSQGSGSIKVDGVQLGNVTGGRFSFSNNLERVETIRDDGLIDGADETEATAEGSVSVRFSTDDTITAVVDAETPVAMEYGFTIPGAEGFKLLFAMPRVFLPKRKQELSGPGGVQADYEWRAAFDPAEGHLLQVTLTNDVAGY